MYPNEKVSGYFEKTGPVSNTQEVPKEVISEKMGNLADVFKQSLVLEHKKLLKLALEEDYSSIMDLAYRLSRSGSIFGMNRMSVVAGLLEIDIRENCKEGAGENTERLIKELSDVL